MQPLKKTEQMDAETMVDVEVASDGLEKLRITGGGALNGVIPISGAKNASLPLMCASLLSAEPLTLTNMPCGMKDIQGMAQLLDHLGVEVTFDAGVATLGLRADAIDNHVAPYDIVRKMRASILVLGPLLARVGKARVSLPGGCAIGSRPVDLHLSALEQMGATITLEDGYIVAQAPEGGLKGAKIVFPKVTVTGTENILMAAALAQGETVIGNAALEPEVTDLANCLVAMGADIEGIGTTRLVVRGKPSLHGATHRVIADRIETGTFIIAVALTGGDVLLQGATTEHLSALVGLLETAGVEITQESDGIRVKKEAGKALKGIDVMTEPYPAFPTDLQAQFMTLQCMCDGAAMVTETIFENRFMHVPELVRMGANITVHGSSALIRGVRELHGAPVMATDLRASVALVLAGLVAHGDTVVHRIYHLDRGYENIVEKLSAVGAKVERIR